ncbi:MAG: hypothetical protein JO317_05915 [Verrucomicrobiae bacterium]|nr:hypothetical protein [Verrucomicrobiae bacterium]
MKAQTKKRRFRFERRGDRLLPWPLFLRRLATCFGLACVLVTFALAVGVAGYHFIAGFPMVDAFLDASMILGGMGPVGELKTDPAKLFASFYALFSGLMFISVMGLLLSPIAHRVLHQFHLDEEDFGKR